jgi:plastocyanin
MQSFKNLLIISSILVLVSCSKDGYGPNEVNLGSSNSYNPQSSDYGNTSSTTTPLSQYSLTVSAGVGGTVSTLGGTYNDGATVSITATPSDGYEFAGWNGSNSSSSTITVTINSNTAIEALFNEVQTTETTSLDTSVFNSELIDFNYYLHSSLPEEWITEFNTIINKLESTIPAKKRDGFPETMNIYAWNNSVPSPYTDPNGNTMQGASISGNGTDFWMVLEIPDDEFTNNSSHRYSVIAHEYFHVYQHSLSPAFSIGSDGEFSNPNAMDVKWLIEGSAATFESIYIQENYGINYFEEGQAWGVQDDVLSEPASYEYFSKEDNNYANSVFMILALVKELENVGFSTEKAFQSIFKVYWEQDPKNSDWKNKFEEVFTIDVDTFYESLSNYSTDMSVIYPSSSITVQNIINDNTDIAQVNTETTSTETTSTETTSSTYNITVTAQNSSDYTLSGSDQNGNVSGNDPSISAKVGDTLSFNVNSPGHDFFIIINSNGGFISTNLPSGVSNNGTANGTVTWTPSEAGTYYYICEFHPAMIGTITITQ